VLVQRQSLTIAVYIATPEPITLMLCDLHYYKLA